MAKKVTALWVILIILACVGLTGADQGGTIQKFLTTADIQGATGLMGVRLSQSTERVMHFVNKEGKPILIAKFLKSKIYKKSEAAGLGLVKGDVKEIGEDAYYGPKVDTPYILTFKKGDYCVELSTVFDQKVKLYLTMEQLQAIGKIIASRI